MPAEFFVECVTAGMLVSLGVFVFAKNWRHPANVLFVLLCAALSGEILGVALWTKAVADGRSPAVGSTLTQVVYPFVGYFPVLFSWHFPQRPSKPVWVWGLGLFGIAALFSVFGFQDRYMRLAPAGSSRPWVYTPYYYALLVYMTACAVGTVLTLRRTRQRAQTHVERRKITYVSLGIGMMLGVGIILGDLLPVFGIYQAQPYSLIAYPLFIGLSAYAICKHRALDVTTIIHKTLIWLVLTSAAVLPLFALFAIVEALLGGYPLRVRLAVEAVLGFLVTGVHFRLIQPRIDHIFQRRRYDLLSIVDQFARELVAVTELQRLAERVCAGLQEVLYVEPVEFLIVRERRLVSIAGGNGLSEPLTPHHPLLETAPDALLEYEQVRTDPALSTPYPWAQDYCERIGARVVVPLVHEGLLRGVIHLGPKTNLKPFTELDLELLARLRPHITIALLNSLLMHQWNEQLEAEVRRKTSELARSNADLEQFAYVASHDLQEPLRTVCGFVQLLAKRYAGQLDARAAEYITFVVDGVKRMQTLILDLLAYSRVGTQEHALAPTDCSALVDQILATLQTGIGETGATVTRDPLPTVQADCVQLTQLFQNLIGNALKFHRKGVPPVVHVSATLKHQEWLFGVQDNGIGIEAPHTDRIFAIFQRLHPSSDYPGSGVGLAICKKIVERHGGRIWVASTPGRGSAFYFTLPELG